MRKVLYSGMFDLLHLGHVRALQKAKKLGDYLSVHVAGDRETKAAKGRLRPVIPASERAEMLLALECVDEVISPSNYCTIEELIKITGANVVVRNEGSTEHFSVETVCLPRSVPDSGLDTTGIIRKIQSIPDQGKIHGVNYMLIVDGSILLQKRDDIEGIRCPGMWAIPGGRVEADENPHEAVARELKEETGVEVSMDEFEFFEDFTYPWEETSRFFVIRLRSKPLVVSKEGSFAWVPINKIDRLAGGQEAVLHTYDGLQNL